MATNYPIIETQLRLIRALQKGYAEALEVGDWQTADYRAAHLQKLCEGLHYLNQLLSKGNGIPKTVASQNRESWVSIIRAVNPTPSLSPSTSLITDTQPVSPPPLPELKPEQIHDEWHNSFRSPKPKPIDEVW